MRAATIERVKRRVLQQAVAENIDVIRGLPPRAVRPLNRIFRVWLKRAPLVLVPLMLAGSTYLATQPEPVMAVARAVRASAVPTVTPTPATAPLERVTAA